MFDKSTGKAFPFVGPLIHPTHLESGVDEPPPVEDAGERIGAAELLEHQILLLNAAAGLLQLGGTPCNLLLQTLL